MGHQHDDHHHPDADVARRLDAVGPAIERLEAAFARFTVPGSWLRMKFTFEDATELDDKGGNALALAVYNPNDFTVYVGTGGVSAAKDSFPVPPNKLVVAPLQVNGPIQFLADLKEGESGYVWRVRFPTLQPFFVGDL